MNYKNKYLKYKNRYNYIKNQFGGAVIIDFAYIGDIEGVQYEINKYRIIPIII